MKKLKNETKDQPEFPVDCRKETAIHEAGHVAAHAFFYHQWSHIAHVTIEEDQKNAGHVRIERMMEPTVRYSGLPLKHRIQGATVEAICLLAGPVAESLHRGEDFDFYEQAEFLADDGLGFLVEEIELPGTDSHRIAALTQFLRRPFFPDRQIITEWTRLTVEILGLPAVWKAVENCASLLLQQRTILPDQLDHLFGEILGLGMRRPEWNRRRRAWSQMTDKNPHGRASLFPPQGAGRGVLDARIRSEVLHGSAGIVPSQFAYSNG